MPGTPVPGTPVPGKPVPGTPVPGTPVPGTPVPGTPVPGIPNRRSSYPPNLKKQKINVFNLIEKSNIVTQNNNRTKTNTPLAIQATIFLTELGIRHGDRQNNLFIYKKNGKDIFFWIDFEAAGFTKNALNSLKFEQKTFAELNDNN